jgi:hypothetical protein
MYYGPMVLPWEHGCGHEHSCHGDVDVDMDAVAMGTWIWTLLPWGQVHLHTELGLTTSKRISLSSSRRRTPNTSRGMMMLSAMIHGAVPALC